MLLVGIAWRMHLTLRSVVLSVFADVPIRPSDEPKRWLLILIFAKPVA